jgi:hypothetical protein
MRRLPSPCASGATRTEGRCAASRSPDADVGLRHRLRRALAALTALLAMGVAVLPVSADAHDIAVLDFELNDLTLTPNSQEDRDRAARLGPMLRDALSERGLTVVPVTAAAQSEADKGFGYLFEHPDEAAVLARSAGADWVVTCRLHKPSFLFSYLKVRLIDARTGEMTGNFTVEIKGKFEDTARRGVRALTEQILEALPPA